MAHFYGTIKGNRGGASRLGSKNGGLNVSAASWQGAVDTRLWHDAEHDIDMAEVRLRRHHGAGSDCVLYHGPVSGEVMSTKKKGAEVTHHRASVA